MARGFDIEASNEAQLNGGAVVGPRAKYNFIEGPGGLTIAVADNPGNDSVDITLDASSVTAGVQGAADAGAAVGPQPTIRLIAGANITIGLFEDVPGNELEFTISAAAGGFPGFDPAVPPADSGAGSAGASGLAARGDHTHPSSTAYTSRDGIEICIGIFDTNGTVTMNYSGSGVVFSTKASFRPRLCISDGKINSGDHSIGFGIGATANEQVVHNIDGNAVFTGLINSNTSASNAYQLTTFSTTQTILTHLSGTATHKFAICTIGDNLP
jgi:hypothetical protein